MPHCQYVDPTLPLPTSFFSFLLFQFHVPKRPVQLHVIRVAFKEAEGLEASVLVGHGHMD